jgi:hypothetical protein
MEAEADSGGKRTLKKAHRKASGRREEFLGAESVTPLAIPRNSSFLSHPHPFHWSYHQPRQQETEQTLGNPFHVLGIPHQSFDTWNHQYSDFISPAGPIFLYPRHHIRMEPSNSDLGAFKAGHQQRISSRPDHVAEGRLPEARWDTTSRDSNGPKPMWSGRNIFAEDSTAGNSPSTGGESDGHISLNLVRDVGQLDIVCGRYACRV